MSDSYTLSDLQRMSAGEPEAYSLSDLQKMAAKPSTFDSVVDFVKRDFQATPGRVGNLAAGAVRGAGSIGATLLAPWDIASDAIQGRGLSLESNRKRRQDMTDALQTMGADPTSLQFQVSQLGGEIAGTAGAGSAMAAAIRAAGYTGKSAQIIANVLESGGMRTGSGVTAASPFTARAGDMALRTAGGAVTGGASAAMVDPNTAGTGAMIGAALPGTVAALGTAGRAVHRGAQRLFMPADVKAARDIAQLAGIDPNNAEDMARLIASLRPAGPNIIPGQQTVTEILQHPAISQLQRSVSAVRPEPFVARAAEREAARRGVLENIAPTGRVKQVAEEVGQSITDYALPQHQAAQAGVRAKFASVDPFDQSAVLLPIDEMRAAKDRFLGPGTFGTGRAAQQAIDEAERIGSETFRAVRPVAAGRRPQDILSAVRSMGGISPNSAGGMNKEIAELGRRQTGTTGLVSAKGRTIDEMAEALHERGFLQNEDPSELLNAIRDNLGGRHSYGADVVDDAFRARYERAMGDAPLAETMAKPVPFQELQNLRSSIGEQWQEAHKFGRNKEAAALAAQKKALDDALDRLAAGRGQEGEFFAPDMVRNYQEARAAHAAKELRFKTGPQAGLFRQGGDGLPLAQGGEVPRRFFNANGSQVADAQSFRRLVQDDPRLMNDLRRFAVSDAAGQVDRFGNLTSSKFNKWLEARSGATGEIFNEQQRAWLKAIADDLKLADLAESLGRSSGSDTAQKAASMVRLGVLDNPAARHLAYKVPFGLGVAALDFVGGAARTAKAERLGGLLMSPERTAGLLDTFVATQQPSLGLLGQAINPALARIAPVALSR